MSYNLKNQKHILIFYNALDFKYLGTISANQNFAENFEKQKQKYDTKNKNFKTNLAELVSNNF